MNDDIPPSHLPPDPLVQPLQNGWLKQLYIDAVQSITEPRRFYTERYPQMSQNYAIAFGLVVSWFAAGLKWLTRVVRHESLMDGFLRIRDQLQQLPLWKDLPPSIWAQNQHVSVFPAWIAEVSSVALFPFSFLISVAINSLAITIGSALFIRNRADPTQDKTGITHFMKLVSVASTPVLVGAILSFLPLSIGAFVGALYSFCMLIFAITIRYRVSKLRSFAVIVTPWAALSLVGACFLGIFGAMILAVIGSLLGNA
ncbi:MAG: hypothetical protein JST80_09545 [Bdellovibrionales bacterium]|nr:hypothetical protein [Bdellovibrionales bacterium]